MALRRKVVEIQKTTLRPWVYFTRDQPEAFALADQVAIINKGEIQQVGTRAELFNTPANLWVAQWLGFPPMNSVTGYLQGTYVPEGLCFRVWGKSVTPLLSPRWTATLSSLQCPDVVVGIRPEDIIPEWEFMKRWKSSYCTVRVKVLASEWSQGRTLAQLQLPYEEDKFMAVFDISHDQIQIGQVFSIAFDPELFCLFHPRTQKLLPMPVLVQQSGGRPFLQKYRTGNG
jgi:ABC-type sugar transport system ATPase subunit